MMTDWRVGRKVPLNVYEGDAPVCQCHNAQHAATIVDAVNLAIWLEKNAPETLRTWRQAMDDERAGRRRQKLLTERK